MADSHFLKKIKLKYHDIPVQVKLAMWILICTVIQKALINYCADFYSVNGYNRVWKSFYLFFLG